MFKSNWKTLTACTLLTCAVKLIAVGEPPSKLRQRHVDIGAIRMHGVMTNDFTSLDLSVAIKGQNKIRATFLNKQGVSSRSVYLLNGSTLKEFHEIEGTLTELVANRLDSATTLTDLIALNPDYHFQTKNNFDLSTPILEGYILELTREPDAFFGTGKHKPLHLHLFEENEDKKLIRSIQFISFHKAIQPFFQPKEIRFTDETTGVSATILIDQIEYNPGLPNFLFEASKSSHE